MKTTKPALRTLVMPLLAMSSSFNAQRETSVRQQSLDPLDLAGCYQLEWRQSNRPAAFRDIESRIWLTTVQVRRQDSIPPYFVVRPAPGTRASIFEQVNWRVTTDGTELWITWSSGFHGVHVHFKLQPEKEPSSLEGVADTFSDALGAKPQSTPVVARPYDCP